MSSSQSDSPRPGARSYLVWILVLAILPLVLLLRRTPSPVPHITTAGLDPAVARLIDATLAEVRAAPRSGEMWGKLGSVLMHYAFVEESRRAFERAEQLPPANPRWPYLHALLLVQRGDAAALPKLQRAVELTGEQTDAPRLQLAQWLAAHGRVAEAEAHFQSLLRATPNHAPALLGLARSRHASGKWLESTNLLQRCLTNPHTARAGTALLAASLQQLGNAAAAKAAARRSAALPGDAPWPDPFWAETLVWRVGKLALLEDASALIDRWQPAEALKPLAIVTRDYPSEPEGWYLAGWALNQLQRGAEAERALREHLRREPQSPKGHAQLAVALLAQRRPAEAIEVLHAAILLKPTWRELHSNLGYACVQLGREDEALQHYETALALDPNHVPTCTALAELHLRRDRKEEALRLVRLALELDPGDARADALLRRLRP